MRWKDDYPHHDSRLMGRSITLSTVDSNLSIVGIFGSGVKDINKTSDWSRFQLKQLLTVILFSSKEVRHIKEHKSWGELFKVISSEYSFS